MLDIHILNVQPFIIYSTVNKKKNISGLLKYLYAD